MIIFLFLVFLGGCAINSIPTNSVNNNSQKRELQVCPDRWVDDRMPYATVKGEASSTRQYYILNGKRMEKSEFDANWVKEHCKLPQNVVE